MAIRSLAPVMVGRQEALQTLEGQLQAALSGTGPTVVLVSGEAGIGKSRLVAEGVARVRATLGTESVVGHCHERDVAVPYAPFIDALRALSRRFGHDSIRGAAGPYIGDLIALVPELATGEVPLHTDDASRADAGTAHYRLVLALSRVLAHAGTADGTPGRRILVLEDLHWAGQASHEIFIDLARAGESIALVCTYRLEAVERPHPLAHIFADLIRERRCAEIRLSPLPRPDLRRLLETTLERPVGTGFLDLLHARSGGNPFYCEELLRSLIERGQLEASLSADVGELATMKFDIPLSIRESILGRVDELGEDYAAILSTAAVVGREFDFAMVQRVCRVGEDALARVLARCIALQLIVEDEEQPEERYRFRHALTQETIYNGLTGRDRIIKHRAILHTVEAAGDGEDVIDLLAYHSLRAREFARATRYAERAGHRAMRHFAYRDAAIHYHVALLHADPTDLRRHADLHFALAKALYPLRAGASEHEHWQAAHDLYTRLGDSAHVAELNLWLGRLAWEGGAGQEAFPYLAAAIDSLERDAPGAELAGAYAEMARMHMLANHPPECLAWCKKALALADRLGDDRIRAGVLISMGVALHNTGAIDEAMDALKRGLDLALRTQNGFEAGRGYVNTGELLLCQGEYERALALYREHATWSARSGWEVQRAAALDNVARSYLELGRWEEARAALDELIDAGEASRHVNYLLWGLPAMGELLLRQGKLQEARDVLERARPLCDKDALFMELRNLYGALPRLYLALGARERARADLERGITSWRKQGPQVGQESFLLFNVESALALGRGDLAEELAVALATLAERARTGLACAADSEARARLAEATGDPAAEALWREAAARWAELHMPYQEGRARRRLGEQGPRAPNDGPVPQGGTPGARGTRGTPSGLLTPRELDVLRLVARGESTATIAAKLVLSEHTVHRHVANILAKLAVPTRAAAVAVAAQQGWV